MTVSFNEFFVQQLIESIINDTYRIVESQEIENDENVYEWDFEPKNPNKEVQSRITDKLKKLVNYLPKEKLKKYYTILINKLEGLPTKIRRFFILHYTSIFLTVVSLSFLLSGQSESDHKNSQYIKPKLLKEVETLTQRSSFREAQIGVKQVESGYSDDRGDSGNYVYIPGYGRRFVGTNHGISALVLAEYLGRPPKREDMENLDYQTALLIFKTRFWDANNLDQLCNQSVANIIYDGCVNQGASRLKNIVQNACIKLDQPLQGETFSPENMKKINSLDQKQLFDTIKSERADAYRNAATWKRHGRGWMKRLDSITYQPPIGQSTPVLENFNYDLEYFFDHLKGDGFEVGYELGDSAWVRLFKPTQFSGLRGIYSYVSCDTFKWSDVSSEVDRFINEIGQEEITWISAVVRNGYKHDRIQISFEQTADLNFDPGLLISVTIGFK